MMTVWAEWSEWSCCSLGQAQIRYIFLQNIILLVSHFVLKVDINFVVIPLPQKRFPKLTVFALTLMLPFKRKDSAY